MLFASRASSASVVLVVDDDPLIARIVERVLRPMPYEVVSTRRSIGVLNLITTHRPVLVLLDVNMPGLGGPSVVKLIREDPSIRGTTVLLHSAIEEAALSSKARESGADGYIAKAAGVQGLERSLERWLTRRSP